MHESMISHRLPIYALQDSAAPQLPILRIRICIVKLPQVHQRLIHIVFRPQGLISGAYFRKLGVLDGQI